jgi:hypothetical protein
MPKALTDILHDGELTPAGEDFAATGLSDEQTDALKEAGAVPGEKPPTEKVDEGDKVVDQTPSADEAAILAAREEAEAEATPTATATKASATKASSGKAGEK